MEDTLSSSLIKLPEETACPPANCWENVGLRGTDVHTVLSGNYFTWPCLFSLCPAALWISRQWGGSEKTLQKWPLKTILRSSVFHGADLSLGLVSWLQDRRRRVWVWFCGKLPPEPPGNVLETPQWAVSPGTKICCVRLNFPACTYCRVLTRLRKVDIRCCTTAAPRGRLSTCWTLPLLALPWARNPPIPGGEGSQHFRLLHFLSWLCKCKEGKP